VGTTLVHLALISYTSAAIVYLAWLVKPAARLALVGRVLLGVGVLCHIAAFAAVMAANPGAVPWRNGQLFSMLAAATVIVYLGLDLRYGLPVAGSFVAPLAVVAMVPAHLRGGRGVASGPLPIAGALLPFHVAAATLGSVALLLAFALAVLYLASERQLKRKQPGRLFSRLPSLELVDRLGWQLSVWGFVLLSIVIVTGAFVTRQEGLGYFHLEAKSGFALLAWLLLAASIQARLVAGWRGRRVAILVVVGFFLLVCSYAGLVSRSPLGVDAAAALGPGVHARPHAAQRSEG
jgi:ABC-type uncharacterized transport system permease subunit